MQQTNSREKGWAIPRYLYKYMGKLSSWFCVIQISIQLGIYCVYWRELLRLFQRKQILALQHTELQDVERLRKKVFDFLEIGMYL